MPLTLFPHYGSVLGGTAVQVFGPCFDNFLDRNITCSFDGVKVPGIYVDENSIICISPALTTHGRVDFILSISNSTVKFKKATFYSCKYMILLCTLYTHCVCVCACACVRVCVCVCVCVCVHKTICICVLYCL